MTDKKYEKMVKILGPDLTIEIEALDEIGLKGILSNATEAMEAVVRELEENEKYQELKAQVSAATQGKRDVFKFQKAKIAIAIDALQSKGKA